MTFYQKCLGGKLFLKKVGDSPKTEKLPKKIKDYILYSTLVKKDLVLMGTDIVEDIGLRKGNDVSLLLNCESEKEIKEFYRNLSLGGIESQPIMKNYWGALTGNLTDKFGYRWLLHFSNK